MCERKKIWILAWAGVAGLTQLHAQHIDATARDCAPIVRRKTVEVLKEQPAAHIPTVPNAPLDPTIVKAEAAASPQSQTRALRKPITRAKLAQRRKIARKMTKKMARRLHAIRKKRTLRQYSVMRLKRRLSLVKRAHLRASVKESAAPASAFSRLLSRFSPFKTKTKRADARRKTATPYVKAAAPVAQPVVAAAPVAALAPATIPVQPVAAAAPLVHVAAPVVAPAPVAQPALAPEPETIPVQPVVAAAPVAALAPAIIPVQPVAAAPVAALAPEPETIPVQPALAAAAAPVAALAPAIIPVQPVAAAPVAALAPETIPVQPALAVAAPLVHVAQPAPVVAPEPETIPVQPVVAAAPVAQPAPEPALEPEPEPEPEPATIPVQPALAAALALAAPVGNDDDHGGDTAIIRSEVFRDLPPPVPGDEDIVSRDSQSSESVWGSLRGGFPAAPGSVGNASEDFGAPADSAGEPAGASDASSIPSLKERNRSSCGSVTSVDDADEDAQDALGISQEISHENPEERALSGAPSVSPAHPDLPTPDVRADWAVFSAITSLGVISLSSPPASGGREDLIAEESAA